MKSKNSKTPQINKKGGENYDDLLVSELKEDMVGEEEYLNN